MNHQVAMWPDVLPGTPKIVRLGAIIDAIKAGRYRAQVEPIRATYSKVLAETGDMTKAKDAISEPKKNLPAFTISGTAADRKTPLEHSNLLQIDLDGLNGTLTTIRDKVKADKHVAFGFVSPSGDGLKLGLAIDGQRHAESFETARDYFKLNYGVAIDEAVKDRLRLCFVSHDPEAWTNDTAEPLPVPDKPATPELQPPTTGTAELSVLVLPSGNVSISESARALFSRIAPSKTMFFRGGALVEAVETEGVAGLDLVKPDSFRSRAERFGLLMAWRSGNEGQPVLKSAKMSRDDATAIMAAMEARELLPPVASVLRCPVIVESGEGEVAILGRGYHNENGGLLIVSGSAPEQVPAAEAVDSLRYLVSEFDFQTVGDESRALAAFITPALRIGGFLRGNIPADVAEADQSQSGKGYRHTLICALYNEASYFVTSKAGGVGSVDESFAAALIAGRPFICLDNFRGKLDSQHLEAFLTCPSLFPARIPHRGEVQIDPKRFLLQMSSNGLEATADLANRTSFCRIRKRPGFQYRDTLGDLQRRQPYFLGCVFAVIGEWIAAGKPRTTDTRHDFREWCQTLDWIVQNVFGSAPLMDGHQAAQQRASNPALSWLRSVALAVERETRLGGTFTASELAELCMLHDIEVPGLKTLDEDAAKRQVGCLMRRCFKEGDSITVDGFVITRAIRQQYRSEGGAMDVKTYTVTKP